MTVKKWAAAFLTVAIAIGLLWSTFARPIVYCAFLQEDIMDKAFCRTHEVLSDYEARPEAAIDWILAEHDGAPGMQVMLGLLDWALKNQDAFIDLLSRMPATETEALLDRLLFAAEQSGRDGEFVSAFRRRSLESEPLQLFLSGLKER